MAFIPGSDFPETLLGTADDDTILALAGDDTILADAGNDLIDGGLGNDSIDGGDGIDTGDYSAATASVKVNLLTGLTVGAMGIDTLTSIENIIGSAYNDSLTGDTNDNVIIGGNGADTMYGGGGIDTVDYSGSSAKVIVSLVAGSTGIGGAAQGDKISQFENITGSAFNDSLTGDTGANVLDGGDGADTLIGGDGADTLIGGTGKDQLTGGLGDDTYFVDNTLDKVTESANAGYDEVIATQSFTLGLNLEKLTLDGTSNIDGTGNSLANLVVGNSGDNVLNGGSGNDTLIGGDGNDTMHDTSGADDMSGGNGDDVYYVDNAGDTLHEDLDAGHDTVYTIYATTLGDNFEDLTLTASSSVAGTGNALDNVIQGNSGANLLTGNDGNDTLIGDDLSDTLHGGNDTLDGGSGDNTLIGGNGNDTYILTTGSDTIIEQANGGIDVVQTSQSHTLEDNVENLVLGGAGDIDGAGNGLANSITGNSGDNALSGDAGNDSIYGGIGNDTLDGGTGADAMVGGSGNDQYIVDNVGDTALESAGLDIDEVRASVTFTLGANIENLTAMGVDAIDLTGNTLANLIQGNDADNKMFGSAGDDSLIGNGGADSLDGGNGADSMAGGDGDDIYVVENLADLTVEGNNKGIDTVQSSISWTLSSNVENLTLTGNSGLNGTGNGLDNFITGTIGNNILSGGNGNDTLIGGDGKDKLNGGAGDDSMVGGTGNDIYNVSSAGDVLVEDADAGIDTVNVDLSYTLADNFEKLVLTGTDNVDGTGNSVDNVLRGNSGNNVLDGDGGNDNLSAGNGNDTLIGGTGADTMAGGQGADTYFVDDVGDKIVEVSAHQVDVVFSTVDYTLSSYVDNLILQGTALNGTGNGLANQIEGTSDDNLLKGSGGNDTLLGFGGNDTLDGGAGDDSMVGGNGNDTYIVNTSRDKVNEAATLGHDIVFSSVDYTLGARVEDLTLTGTSRLAGTGNTDNNVIVGNEANNQITGLEGNDTLTGGAGADRFIFTAADAGGGVFTAAGNGTDTITDFNGIVSGTPDGDKMQFDANLLTDHFDYIGNVGFTGQGYTEARIFNDGRVVMDFNGDGTGDLTILLTGLNNEEQLTIADFIFG